MYAVQYSQEYKQMWLFCPQCFGLLSSDTKDFRMPGDDSVNSWHRLHYGDYLDVQKYKKRFCPKCSCVEPVLDSEYTSHTTQVV